MRSKSEHGVDAEEAVHDGQSQHVTMLRIPMTNGLTAEASKHA